MIFERAHRLPTCTCALDFCKEFLLDGVHELGPEVAGVQHYLMVQRYVVEHPTISAIIIVFVNPKDGKIISKKF